MNEMAGNVLIPFALGTEVWWVGPRHTERYYTCPDCAGNLYVTMTLGNGDVETIPCGLCAIGYEPPRGRVKHTVCGYEPTRFVCERVRIDGDCVSYMNDSHYVPDVCDLYADEASCAAACEVKRVEAQAEKDAQIIRNRASKRRDLARSVSYWRSQRKKLREELEHIEVKLTQCEQRKTVTP